MVEFKRLFQKRIFAEIEHAQAEIETGAKVNVHLMKLLRIKRVAFYRRTGHPISGNILVVLVWCHFAIIILILV